VRGYFLLNL